MNDRVLKALERLVNVMMRRVDYHALYPARVVAQSGQKVDLLADDLRIRGQGHQGIPLRHGLPGIEVTVPVGARVLLGFRNGDPAKPYAALWESGAVTLVVLGAPGSADFVALNAKVEGQLQRLKSAITTATTAPNDGGAAFKSAILTSLNAPPAFPESMAAVKFKAE